MTTAIQNLRDAAKKVADATGESFIFAGLEVRHEGDVEFRVYRRITHVAKTLEEAVEKAVLFDDKAEKLHAASELRKRADLLEKEAS